MKVFLNKKNQKLKKFKKKYMDLRGIDPLTFRMQSGRSTTELQALLLIVKP
jgi:hypothetical protein